MIRVLALLFLLTLPAAAQFATPRDLAFWGKRDGCDCCGGCVNPYSLPVYPNLIWHLDAALNITNAAGAAPASGDRISVWKDATTGQEFTQTENAVRPLYDTTGTNCRPSVAFEGFPDVAVSDWLTNYNAVTYAQTNTVFFVCNINQPASAFHGQEILDSGHTGRALMEATSDNGWLGMYAGSVFYGGEVVADGTTSPWFVWSAQFNGANSFMRTNGVLYASGDAGGDPFVGFTLGCANNPAVYYQSGWNGRIAEAIFYNSGLSTNEMRQVENYLMGKHCIPVPP